MTDQIDCLSRPCLAHSTNSTAMLVSIQSNRFTGILCLNASDVVRLFVIRLSRRVCFSETIHSRIFLSKIRSYWHLTGLPLLTLLSASSFPYNVMAYYKLLLVFTACAAISRCSEDCVHNLRNRKKHFLFDLTR